MSQPEDSRPCKIRPSARCSSLPVAPRLLMANTPSRHPDSGMILVGPYRGVAPVAKQAAEKCFVRRARVQPCRKCIRIYTALAAEVRSFAAVSERLSARNDRKPTSEAKALIHSIFVRHD